MRWLRTALASALLTGIVLGFTPMIASAAALLVVNPSSIGAGFQVEVRAICGDNVNPAFVNSRAFGAVTLVPNKGVLSANVTVPSSTRTGTYTVNLSCASGQKASTELDVIGGGAPPNPNHGPHTGGGQMAAGMGGKVTLYGGLGAIALGLGLWLVLGVRRRTTV
jgi:hypothetical protein